MKIFNATDKELWDILDNRIKFISMDKNGLWSAFWKKPALMEQYWGLYTSSSGPRIALYFVLHVNKEEDWKKSLTRRPE